MNNASRTLPVYSADTAGVCSSLYELGGMVVVHDASGCNSTYSTHDELRWYDKESAIFISGLSELDAVLGDDEKFISDVERAARDLGPRFIALCGSPMPMMMATDFDAIAVELEERTGIPVLPMHTNAIGSYVDGASEALAAIAERFFRRPAGLTASRRPRVAVLGMTPLDFGLAGVPSSIGRWLDAQGFDLCASLALDCTWKDVENAAHADVALVASSLGLAPSRILEERFHIPHVVGVPYGAFAPSLADALREAISTRISSCPCALHGKGENDILVIGESVTSASLACAIEAALPCGARVLAPLADAPTALAAGDLAGEDEERTESLLHDGRTVVADPIYKMVAHPGCDFHALPHVAFSGRCHARFIPNLVDEDPVARLGLE